MSMLFETLSMAPLIGATSVISAHVLFHRLKSSKHVKLFEKTLTGFVWFLFLFVGMLVSDSEDRVVPILFWILQMTTTILLFVIVHPEASVEGKRSDSE